MPQNNSIAEYVLVAGGGALTAPVSDVTQEYLITGSATLAGSYTFAESGTVEAGQMYVVHYNATMTLGGNSITIFGRVLTQEQALNKFVLVAIYSGTSFSTFILPDTGLLGRFYHGVTANTVLAAGGTVSLNPALAKGFQTFGSAVSPSLLAGYAVTSTGTPIEGDEFWCLWTGGVVPNGQTVTIFGEVLSDSQVLNGGVLVHVVYSGSAWVVLEGATIPSSSIVSKSYAQLQTLVAASTLQINTTYFVNDRNLWIKAISSNKFELQGSFKMLAPDYQDVSGLFGGVWISTMGLPAIGDLYSYNNFMWSSVTGAVGTAPSGDAVNWLCVGTYGSGTWKDWVNKTGSYYQEEIYACEYDFINDWVQLLHDKRRGNKIGGSYQYEQTVSNGFNVIDKFQWGRNTQLSNRAIEAYLNNVNTTGVYTANELVAGGELVLAVASSSNLILINNINTSAIVYEASLTIPTASVLTLFATPLDIVAAPGAGYAIEVIAASGSMTYNSIAYATNGKLQLITDTATKPQTETTANGFLFGTATRIAKFPLSTPTAIGETQLIANKSLKVAVDAGNPTAGNSDIKVYVLYRIIEI